MKSQLRRSERDVYANLLRESRGMRRDHALARDQWFAGLQLENKEDALFELEMLLKGLACFGNPRNHPGPPRRQPAAQQDFQPEIRVVRDTIDRCVSLVQKLLGDKDRAYAFTKYLETVLPADAERTRLVREQVAQDTPEDSLFVLRNAFSSYLEICDALVRLGRTPHRLYLATMATIVREIGRNVHFNPLVELEFRAELDRVKSAEIVDALEAIESDAAHRIMSLTFLTLFRALRYLQLVDLHSFDKATIPLAYVILTVLRSDLRTLTRFAMKRAGGAMADSLERELLGIPATELNRREGELEQTAATLTALRGTLEATANILRIEVRRALDRTLPSVDSIKNAEIGPALRTASASLRASIQHAILVLYSELAPKRPQPTLADTESARRAIGERLRGDVWMFIQVLRAFLAKARVATEVVDAWGARGDFSFVRQFLTHFRALGYPLVRVSQYEHVAPLLLALESIRDVELLDPVRLSDAVVEATRFYERLEAMFDEISRRDELVSVPFDRTNAAEALKIYLGAA